MNERDGLGDNLPPDYVTRVTPGGFYGWPWFYIGGNQDPRHKGEHDELKDKVVVPDVLLQPHSAPLGLAVYTGTQFPAEYRGDIFVASARLVEPRAAHRLQAHPRPAARRQADRRLRGFHDRLRDQDGAVWGRPVGVVVAAGRIAPGQRRRVGNRLAHRLCRAKN